MTDHQRAKELVDAARSMREVDAIELIAAHLALVRVQGARSGIEEAARAVAEMRPTVN